MQGCRGVTATSNMAGSTPQALLWNDLWANMSPDRPFRPVVEIRLKIEVHEPVPQRPRHCEVDTPFGCGIPGGDHDPLIGQSVFAETTIPNQLIAAGLRHLWRRSQLIAKENALPEVGRNLGGTHSV